jgi:hypothetical protein
MRRVLRLVVVAAVALAAFAAGLRPATAAGASTISGVAFQDINRNGVQDSGEAPFSGQHLQLIDTAAMVYVATATTATDGSYAFSGLPDGSYVVQLTSSDWAAVRDSWVPTTTGGDLRPRVNVQLLSSARADFGYRPLVVSTTLGQPISSAVGPNGPKVEVYNDAIRASDALADLLSGSLIGAEAAYTTVRIGYDSASSTTTSVLSSGGTYTSYKATSAVTYGAWLDGGDQTMFHEYGHSWSLYFAYMVQQDSSLNGYVQARGLTGDARIGTSYLWSPREMIAEDYRQLFGTENAKARRQANGDIPPAADVAGLADYLATTFRSGSTATTAPAPTAAPLTVSQLTVTPQPVTTAGTVSFTLSQGASVSVSILTSSGSLVRSLAANMAAAQGANSFGWDRKDARGRKVKGAWYIASVTATSNDGQQVKQDVSFQVS